ncbi:zinc ribbon domain-containing protein [Actinomadura atramentaria]|uniref:zinc ribbon domain-containing protein n=1 Tax=Actinomadura atramentaria TaxID=1990 RepID=UPI0012FC70DA|nr:zinc ribbon domain-containing protein [Actinomadura atramentaria]
MVPFTSNYTDQSSEDGYQFEFRCNRCGNGYASSFQRSVTGVGGKLLEMGGGLLGGEVGNKASSLGWDLRWLRNRGERSGTRDRMLARAVEEVSPQFVQCHRCSQWVCRSVCWNGERGLCSSCAPKLDQEIAGMQAAAQIRQLDEKIQQQDWTEGVQYKEQATGLCGSCGEESGGNKFCRNCGAPQASAPAETKKFCTNCGTQLGDAKFCGGCGWPAG